MKKSKVRIWISAFAAALFAGTVAAGIYDAGLYSQVPLTDVSDANRATYIADAKAAGLDGAILPDVPHEESAELREICAKQDFRLID